MHTQSIVNSIANKHYVYSPLECTTNVYIIHAHIVKIYIYSHSINKYAYKHNQVLSSIRQETLHGVRSENLIKQADTLQISSKKGQ